MPGPKDTPAYIRAHRAKRQLEEARVDLGTIAVGVSVMLVGFAATVLVPPDPDIAAVVVGFGVILGGFVAGRLCDPAAHCPACHGGGAALVFAAIAALVALSSAHSAEYELALATLFGWSDPIVFGSVLLGTLAVSTMAAGVGGRGRNE